MAALPQYLLAFSKTGRRWFGVVWVFLSLTFVENSPAQTPDEIFGPQELLCVIEARLNPRLNSPPGAILCDPENSGIEWFFLAGRWYQPLFGLPECGCDFDFDGLTACQEIMLCTYSGINDSDGDCLTDGLEIALGLDPKNPDTDGNGTPDGDEESNGVANRESDFDQDGLSNCQEAMIGTNPMIPDTDGDGWNDEVEDTSGKDPLDPVSKPSLQIVTLSAVHLSHPGSEGVLPIGTFVAYPPVGIEISNQPE